MHRSRACSCSRTRQSAGDASNGQASRLLANAATSAGSPQPIRRFSLGQFSLFFRVKTQPGNIFLQPRLTCTYVHLRWEWLVAPPTWKAHETHQKILRNDSPTRSARTTTIRTETPSAAGRSGPEASRGQSPPGLSNGLELRTAPCSRYADRRAFG